MKILVVGVHFYSSFSWSIVQSFRRLGHEVVEFDYRNNPFQKILLAKDYFYEVVMQKKLIGAVKKNNPDLVFICKGELIKPQTISEIKKINLVKIVNWFPDPRLFYYENIVKSLQYLDGFFTKNLDDVKRAKLFNLNNIHLLQHCMDIELHGSPEKVNDGSFDNSVSFIGSFYPYRDMILKNLTEFNLKVFGGGWERSTLFKEKRNSCLGYEARGLEQGKIFYSSTINLNTHHYDDYRAVNQRVFDVCGSSGFLLTDYKSEIASCFEIGKDLETYESLSELKEKIRYFINNPQKAKEIGIRAGKKTIKNHTYDHRIKEILTRIDM